MSDFTNVVDISGTFEETELDEGVDFYATGDYSSIVIFGGGFGEGEFGDGPFGGTQTVVLTVPTTTWVDVDEP